MNTFWCPLFACCLLPSLQSFKCLIPFPSTVDALLASALGSNSWFLFLCPHSQIVGTGWRKSHHLASQDTVPLSPCPISTVNSGIQLSAEGSSLHPHFLRWSWLWTALWFPSGLGLRLCLFYLCCPTLFPCMRKGSSPGHFELPPLGYFLKLCLFSYIFWLCQLLVRQDPSQSTSPVSATPLLYSPLPPGLPLTIRLTHQPFLR